MTIFSKPDNPAPSNQCHWRLVLFFGAILSLLLTGCPDYSHLRQAPDYENMTDGGGESNPKTLVD